MKEEKKKRKRSYFVIIQKQKDYSGCLVATVNTHFNAIVESNKREEAQK